jgi:hypothetical protein
MKGYFSANLENIPLPINIIGDPYVFNHGVFISTNPEGFIA